MQKILEKPYATIYMDVHKKRLYQAWFGYLTVDQFKAAIDISVDCFKEHDLTTILSDTTHQAVLAKEGSDYAASVVPVLMENGMKKVAFILPKSIFTKLAVQNFTEQSQSGVSGSFTSLEEAERWLDK